MSRPIDLIAAARAGDVDTVIELAEASPRALRSFVAVDASSARDDGRAAVPGATAAGPQSPDAETWLPLHFAAAAGRAEVVGLLIDRFGVAVDSRTRYRLPTRARQTALMLAAAAGHADVVDALLQRGAEVEVRDAVSASPLSLAAAAGHAAIVRRLLEAGANPDALDAQRRTPLHAAIRGRHHPDANADARPGDAPQATANLEGRVAAALELIDAGGDPNAPCPPEAEGFTPLHRCAAAGPAWMPVIQALRAAGADPHPRDPRFGRTPKELAVMKAKAAGDEPGWQAVIDALGANPGG